MQIQEIIVIYFDTIRLTLEKVFILYAPSRVCLLTRYGYFVLWGEIPLEPSTNAKFCFT